MGEASSECISAVVRWKAKEYDVSNCVERASNFVLGSLQVSLFCIWPGMAQEAEML